MLVLLSIRPEHVANILTGAKIFEFRRRLFSRTDVRTALIYCTSPVQRIVGEFDIAARLEDTPSKLWRQTQRGSGISKGFFDQYFAGRDKAYALQIGNVRKFRETINPLDIFDRFYPPQSYCYLSLDEFRRKLAD